MAYNITIFPKCAPGTGNNWRVPDAVSVQIASWVGSHGNLITGAILLG